MKTKSLYILWGMLYVLCTLLGFIPNPTGFLRGLMLFFSAVFYFPGFILIHTAHQQNDKKTLRTLRIISAASLALTLAALVANFQWVMASEAVGNLLYVVLVLVSTPMVCSGLWAAPLFIWACLLFATFLKPKK